MSDASDKAYSTAQRLDDHIAGTHDDPWHGLGSPSATGYTSDHARYRFNGDEVEFDVILNGTSGNGTAGSYTYANTLPTEYRPVTLRYLPLAISGTEAAGANHARLQVDTTGSVTIVVPGVLHVMGSPRMPVD